MEKRAGRKASRLQKRREAAAMARKRRGRIIWGIFIAVVAVLLAFSGMYYVTDIEVADNARYTDEEIIDMTCDSPLAGNTLLFSKFKSRIILDDVPFMEYVDVAMKDNHTLLLRVKEKQLVGVLSFGGLDYYTAKDYFDAHREGLLVGTDSLYDMTVFAVVPISVRLPPA